MSKIKDTEFMTQAIAQAKLGAGQTWTNPQVGAVIVKHQKVLAAGYHHRFGAAHAEIDALAQLADIKQAQGATMYVTLEPCSHYGKTPPCANRLVAVGIKRVVIGMLDPNPVVAGKGVAILQAAGIEVTILNTATGLNADYIFFHRHQRPVITMKFAASIDGKINVGNTRTMLTGVAANHDVQSLRATQQAILIGEHTLIMDTPQLTVRDQALTHPPVRIVLAGDADQLDQRWPIFSPDAPTWVLSQRLTHKDWPAHVRVYPGDWSVAAITRLLYQQGVQSLLVEGGSYVQAQFLAAGVVDQIIGYIAPVCLGGAGLPIAVGQPLGKREQLRLIQVTQLDDDIKLEYRRE